jgi:hypothetical protein
MAITDPFVNATGVVDRVRLSFLTGGAAGNLTLTGIATGDKLLSVTALGGGLLGVVGGNHTVTAGEDTAATLDIDTGLASISSYQLNVVTAAGVYRPLADAAVSVAAGVITIADGAATFDVTATDIIYWTATGAETASVAGTGLTSEFTITAANTINNTGGTATTGSLLVVQWYDADWGETAEAF